MCIHTGPDETLFQPDVGMRVSQLKIGQAQLKGKDPLSDPTLTKYQIQQAAAPPVIPPAPASPGAFALQIPTTKVGVPQLRTGPF